MIKAQKEDKNLIVELLTKSFIENKSVNYILPKDGFKEKRIRALMDYSFEICHLFGEVYLSDDRDACALVLFPDQKRTTLKSIWLDLKFIFCCIGLRGIGKTLKRESQIKNKQPKIPMYYIWFIGVSPIHQHSGIGSALLEELLQDAQQKSRPAFLETSTMRNLPWYRRFGFNVYDQLELSYTLYFLSNQPL